MTRPIFITADDYGLCRPVNAAIEDCLEAGAVQSTCVMVNMPEWRASERLAARFPQVAVGLHWTLSQGRPVLPARCVRSLVDAEGQFWPAARFKVRWSRGGVDGGELKAELQAQHAHFVALLGKPAFWNTHQNVHVAPGLLPFFTDVGIQLGISAMRSHCRVLVPRRGSALSHHLRHPWFWLKGAVIASYSAQARRKGMRLPAGYVYAPGFNKATDIAAILTSPLLPPAAELVVHPSTSVMPELFGGLRESRVQEWHALSDPALVSVLDHAGVRPSSFNALQSSTTAALGHCPPGAGLGACMESTGLAPVSGKN